MIRLHSGSLNNSQKVTLNDVSRLTVCAAASLSLSGLCLMFRAEHMGPLNSLLHALFAITLLIPTDSCVKRRLGARC